MKKSIIILTAALLSAAPCTFTGNEYTEVSAYSSEGEAASPADIFGLAVQIPDRSKGKTPLTFYHENGSVAYSVYSGTEIPESKRSELKDYFSSLEWEFPEAPADTSRSHSVNDYIEFAYISDTEIKHFFICYYDEAYYFSYSIADDSYGDGGVYSIDYESCLAAVTEILGTDPRQHQGITISAGETGAELPVTVYEKGDINSDGYINAADASLVLSAYTLLSTNQELPRTIDIDRADYNGDGTVNAADASLILKKYADLSTSVE